MSWIIRPPPWVPFPGQSSELEGETYIAAITSTPHREQPTGYRYICLLTAICQYLFANTDYEPV